MVAGRIVHGIRLHLKSRFRAGERSLSSMQQVPFRQAKGHLLRLP